MDMGTFRWAHATIENFSYLAAEINDKGHFKNWLFDDSLESKIKDFLKLEEIPKSEETLEGKLYSFDIDGFYKEQIKNYKKEFNFQEGPEEIKKRGEYKKEREEHEKRIYAPSLMVFTQACFHLKRSLPMSYKSFYSKLAETAQIFQINSDILEEHYLFMHPEDAVYQPTKDQDK